MNAKIDVLVVEDDEPTRRFIQLTLQEDGLRVTTAADGAEAREKLEGRTFDVVLLDYRLPDTDGLTLLHEVRQRSQHPAVLLLTGLGDEEVAYDALSQGAVDYLVKSPETFEELPGKVRGAWDAWGGMDHLVRTPQDGRAPTPRPDQPGGPDLARFLERSEILGLAVFDRQGRPLLSSFPASVDAEHLATRGAATFHTLGRLAEAAGASDEGELTLIRGPGGVLACLGAPGTLGLVALLPAGMDLSQALQEVRRAARIVHDRLGDDPANASQH